MSNTDASNEKSSNERSTIGFPYLDLETSIEVAKAIYNRSGLGPCGIDELAAELGVTVSGSFRLKLSSAKMFGLIDKATRSEYQLTPLGENIVNTGTEKGARASAFLEIPLYLAIYEDYRGKLLPPAKALEREFERLGVSSKQTDKARQAFERSAAQSGFFDDGSDRLIKPRYTLQTKSIEDVPPVPAGERTVPKKPNGQNVREKDTGLHPFMQGLIDELPAPSSEWPYAKRVKWLQLASNAFDLIYEGRGDITINLNEIESDFF